MPFQGLLITLSTSVTAVAGDGTHGQLRVYVRSQGTGSAYLGSSGVTSSGFPVTTADAPLLLPMYQGETLYATCTGSAVLSVLRFNETTS